MIYSRLQPDRIQIHLRSSVLKSFLGRANPPTELFAAFICVQLFYLYLTDLKTAISNVLGTKITNLQSPHRQQRRSIGGFCIH